VPVMYLMTDRMRERWNRFLKRVKGEPIENNQKSNHTIDPELIASK
jgi:hypothetical protein